MNKAKPNIQIQFVQEGDFILGLEGGSACLNQNVEGKKQTRSGQIYFKITLEFINAVQKRHDWAEQKRRKKEDANEEKV